MSAVDTLATAVGAGAGGALVGLLALARPAPPVRRPASTPAVRGAEAGPDRRDLRARRRVRMGTLLAAIGAGAIVVGPFTVAVLIGGGWVIVLLDRRRRRAADRRRVERQVPDALELLHLALHAGLTVGQAIDRLATRAPHPTRSAFVEVRRRIERGRSAADALGALIEHLGPDVGPTIDTVRLGIRHGSPISRTLDLLADDVRRRRRQQADADARRLPVRLSFPLVVCSLPAFVVLVIVPTLIATLASLGAEPP